MSDEETIREVIEEQEADEVGRWRRVNPDQELAGVDDEVLVQWEDPNGEIAVYVTRDDTDDGTQYNARAEAVVDDLPFSNTSISVFGESLESTLDDAIQWMRRHRPGVPIPTFSMRIEGGIFKPLMDAVRRLGGNHVLIEVRNDGVVFESSSPFNHIEFRIPSADMEEFSVDREGELTAKSDKIWDALKPVNFSDIVPLAIDASEDRPRLQVAAQSSSARVAAEFNRRSIPDPHPFDARFTVPGLEYDRVMNGARIIDSETSVFGARDGVAFIRIEDDTTGDEFTARIETSDIEGEQVVTVNPDFLQALRRAVPRPSQTPLTFTFKGNEPILSEYTVGDTDVDVRIALRTGAVPREVELPPEEITIPESDGIDIEETGTVVFRSPPRMEERSIVIHGAPDVPTDLKDEAANRVAGQLTDEQRILLQGRVPPSIEIGSVTFQGGKIQSIDLDESAIPSGAQPGDGEGVPDAVGPFELRESAADRVYWAVEDGTGVEVVERDGVWVAFVTDDLGTRTRLGAAQTREGGINIALRNLREYQDERAAREAARDPGGVGIGRLRRVTGNDIKGAPANALNSYFQSYEAMREASVAELDTIEGVGPTTIERLQENFGNPEEPPRVSDEGEMPEVEGGDDALDEFAREATGEFQGVNVPDDVDVVVRVIEDELGRNRFEAQPADPDVDAINQIIPPSRISRTVDDIRKRWKARQFDIGDIVAYITVAGGGVRTVDTEPGEDLLKSEETDETEVPPPEEEVEEVRTEIVVSLVGGTLNYIVTGTVPGSIKDEAIGAARDTLGPPGQFDADDTVGSVAYRGTEITGITFNSGRSLLADDADDDDAVDLEPAGELVVGQRTVDVPQPPDEWDSVHFINRNQDNEPDSGDRVVYVSPSRLQSIRLDGTRVSNKWGIRLMCHPSPIPENPTDEEILFGPGGHDSESVRINLTTGNVAGSDAPRILRENFPTVAEAEEQCEGVDSDDVIELPVHVKDDFEDGFLYSPPPNTVRLAVSQKINAEMANVLGDASQFGMDERVGIAVVTAASDPMDRDFVRVKGDVEADADDDGQIEAAEEVEAQTDEEGLTRGQAETIIEEATLGVAVDLQMMADEFHEFRLDVVGGEGIRFRQDPDEITVSAGDDLRETVQNALERWREFAIISNLSGEQIADINQRREVLSNQFDVDLSPLPQPVGGDLDVDDVERIVRKGTQSAIVDVTVNPDADSLRVRMEPDVDGQASYSATIEEVQGQATRPAGAIREALNAWEEAVDRATVDVDAVNRRRGRLAREFDMTLPEIEEPVTAESATGQRSELLDEWQSIMDDLDFVPVDESRLVGQSDTPIPVEVDEEFAEFADNEEKTQIEQGLQVHHTEDIHEEVHEFIAQLMGAEPENFYDSSKPSDIPGYDLHYTFTLTRSRSPGEWTNPRFAPSTLFQLLAPLDGDRIQIVSRGAPLA